jgi:hypothetical protein
VLIWRANIARRPGVVTERHARSKTPALGAGETRISTLRIASREIATKRVKKIKKVWECNSELAKAAENIKNPSSDDTVERFDGEDGSFSREDLLDGDELRQPQRRRDTADREGGRMWYGSLASIDLSTSVIARP